MLSFVWALPHIFIPLLQQAEKVKLFARTWIFTDAISTPYESIFKIDERVLSGAIANIPYYPSYSKFENYFFNLTYKDFEYHPWWRSFFKQYNITAESFEGRTLLKYKKRFFLNTLCWICDHCRKSFYNSFKKLC